MNREQKARVAAHDAMSEVIRSTARLNGAQLSAVMQNIEGIGADILNGAFDGIVAWAVTCRPEDQTEAQFAERCVAALQELLTTRLTQIGPTAGSA